MLVYEGGREPSRVVRDYTVQFGPFLLWVSSQFFMHNSQNSELDSNVRPGCKIYEYSS